MLLTAVRSTLFRVNNKHSTYFSLKPKTTSNHSTYLRDKAKTIQLFLGKDNPFLSGILELMNYRETNS